MVLCFHLFVFFPCELNHFTKSVTIVIMNYLFVTITRLYKSSDSRDAFSVTEKSNILINIPVQIVSDL